MKKLCVYIIFIFINTELNAELLKASPLLDPKQVIQIQLNALKKIMNHTKIMELNKHMNLHIH